MGAVNESVAKLITAGIMIIIPGIIRWLVRRIAERQTVVELEIKNSATGLSRVFKLRKDMSPEEVSTVLQEMAAITGSQE
jgi:hypothetical protein